MTVLVPTFKESSSGGTFKPAVPPVAWYPNPTPSNLSNDLDTTGSTLGWYAKVQTNDVYDLYLQYGQNTTLWATAKVLHYKIELSNEVLNDDGSITVSVKITADVMKSIKTDHAGTIGYSVNITGTIDGKTVWTYNGSTLDNFSVNPSTPSWATSITIPADSDNDATLATLKWHYPNGEFSDNAFKVGLTLHNPRPATYIPDTVYDGSWQKINEGKKNMIYDGEWKAISALALNQQNKVNPASSMNYNNGSEWLQSPLP